MFLSENRIRCMPPCGPCNEKNRDILNDVMNGFAMSPAIDLSMFKIFESEYNLLDC